MLHMDQVNDIKLLKEINRELLKKNKALSKRVSKLKNYLSVIQDRHGEEICEYFDDCQSLYDTAEEFCFESVPDCFHALVEYFGCADPLYNANDWEEYEKEIMGSDYEEAEKEEEEAEKEEEEAEKEEEEAEKEEEEADSNIVAEHP